MKSKTKSPAKRWLAFLLCLCMAFPPGGTMVSAAPAEDGLCEHHTEHTEACGYKAAVEEAPCGHEHDETCGYQEAVEEQPCTHEHDEACGYAEGTEGAPCTFVCEVCSDTVNERADVANESADGVQIQTFSVLPDEIRVQEVNVGVTLEERNLPSELSFTDGDGETAVISGITWQSTPEFDGEAAGEYVFTPVLPEGYMLQEGILLPEICVTVVEGAAVVLSEGNEYRVGSTDELTEAFSEIAVNSSEKATIILTNNVTAEKRTAVTDEEKKLVGGENPEKQSIIGVAGKHIVFTSAEGSHYTLGLSGDYLVGNVTFDDVTWNKSSDIFANGFLLEFTENFEGGCHDYVYGGSDRRAVDSTHLIFNAGSFGNPNSSYFIYGGGYAGGMGTATGPSLGLDGEDGMPGWTPPEFKAGTGDVKGDVTIEIGGTATLTALVGGSRNGNVGGDVTITLQADSADTRTVGWITGAGFANQKGYGHVMGDVTINALSGQTYEIFGTGYGTLPSDCEPGDVNSVAGDVTITVGQESGNVPMYLKGTGLNLIGCGFEFAGNAELGNTVCGDVTMILNKTAQLDDGDSSNTYNQSMYGVYSNSTVRGSVTIINNGAQALFNMVGGYDGAQILGADRDYALKMVMNGGHLRKTKTSYGSMFTTQRLYGNEETVQIHGDVKMEFNDGYTWGIEGEYSYQTALAQIDGDVEITVRGGTIYGNLQGGKVDQSLTDGHTATLIFDQYTSTSKIPYARNFDEVRVTGNSSVIIAAKDGAGNQYTQPFYDEKSVKDLTIDEGSTLALAKNASIYGNLSVEGTLALPRTTTSTTTLIAGGTASGSGTLKPISSTLLSNLGILSWSKPTLNEEYVYAKTDNSDMTLELSQAADNLFVDRKNSTTSGHDVWFINERQETEQHWYYEVYYEFIDPENNNSVEWLLHKEGQGGTAFPNATVAISHTSFDGDELGWEDITGDQNETLGVHYVYDENYGPHRLSALCKEATQNNPLKIYYRAALHDVEYQYEGTVPDGATALLPETGQKPYYSSVKVADVPVLSGYEFSGWTVKSPDYTKIENGAFLMPNETVTLVGSWTKTEEPAAMTVTLTAQDMIAYTGGDSLSEDPFPTARYRIEAAEDVELSKISFSVNGETETLPEGTDSGDVVILPWLNETFTLQESAVMALGAADDDAVAGEYEIGVDAAGVSASYDDGNPVELKIDTGTLTVRNVSEPDKVIQETLDIAQPVVGSESAVNTDDGVGVAVIAGDTKYYTNGREELGVLGDHESDEPQIALLFDDLIPGGEGQDTTQLLLDRAEDEGYALTKDNAQFKYLDLINENDGNAWVSTSDGSTITIYWPVPEGIDPAIYTFHALHFKGLHREYRGDMEQQVADAPVEPVAVEVAGDNLKFTLEGNQKAGSFSPFVIYWEKTSAPEPEPDIKTGNLTVSKVVTGNKGDTGKDFTFTVILDDTSVNGVYGGMTFKDGKAIFTLKHGESMTASGLPDGIHYTVTESGNEGYQVTVSGNEGVIRDGNTAKAEFRNHKEDSGSDSDKGDKPGGGSGSGSKDGSESSSGGSSAPAASSARTVDSAKTYDDTNVILPICLFLLSAGSLAVCGALVLRRQKKAKTDGKIR